MHASLRLNNISRLPDTSKELALSAANGSLDDLEELHRLISESPESQLRLFIPAFYANLSDLRDLPDADLPERFSRAMIALKGLTALQEHLVSRASLDVWSAVWSWIQFFGECEQRYPGVTATSRTPMYTLFLTTMLTLRYDTDAAATIDTTPRVCVFFTRGWAAALEGGQMTQQLVDDLCHCLLRVLNVRDPATLREVREGAGGTPAHLASLMVKHIQYFVPHKDHVVTDRDAFGVLCVFQMLEAGTILEGPLADGFAAHGMVKCACTVICALCESPPVMITEQLIPLNFTIVVSSLIRFPGFTLAKEALESGLLRAFVLSASQHMALLTIPLGHLISDVLPPTLAYHSVLSSLPDALEDARAIEDTPGFRTSAHVNEWTDFVNLAIERIAVMKLYDAGSLAAHRACDNLECPEIRKDDDLRRCSACQNAFYCSPACQTADWAAGHRKLCARPANAHHKAAAHLSAGDRAFLRALLHHDYAAARADVLGAQLRFAPTYPGTPAVVMFDYSGGRLRRAVVPADARVDVNLGARVARSGGRVELHLVLVPEGGANRRGLVFPMRWASARVHERLRELATGGEALTPAMVEELVALEVVSTH
ncbi:hypothetical protein FB451DRAFT_1551191 [Mycena latifolia]|nr:hypothetical protein FB451DRAFT_1551191 [Mycena latifolia]